MCGFEWMDLSMCVEVNMCVQMKFGACHTSTVCCSVLQCEYIYVGVWM